MQKQKLSFATFVDLTRFENTLFGLPFIVAGALLPFAHMNFLITFGKKEFLHALLILPAFLTARISGMAFNQLIDRLIDAKNPRTAGRILPSGRATTTQARGIAFGALCLFVLLCLLINPLCFYLSLIAAFLIYCYSYLKRYTRYCHFALGLIHMLGPIMAAVAMQGSFNVASWFVGLAALCTITGNDILYAIQDFHFDRKHYLYSIPSRQGIKKSLFLAKQLHLTALALLGALVFVGGLAKISALALVFVYFAFIDLHQKVAQAIEHDFTVEKIQPLFFRSNVTVSLLTLLMVLLGVIWAA